MRTIRHRGTIGTSTYSKTKALDLRVQKQSQISICALTASSRTNLIIDYIFEDGSKTKQLTDGGTAQETVATIQTVLLTANVLTILTFNFKLGYIRVSYDDDGTGSPTGGAIRIDATAA